MPITLHIEAETVGDLVAKANAALSGFIPTEAVPAVPTAATEAVKATRATKKTDPPAAEPAIEAEAPKAEDPKPDVPAELSYELHIKPAVLELANAKGKGREVVVALLGDWQAKVGWTAPANDPDSKFRASDVPAEHFAEFYADIQKRLAA